MIPLLLISPDLKLIKSEVEKHLLKNKLSLNHPNLLWFDEEEKLGVEAAKKIREHLSLKPYQGLGQAVIIYSAHDLTTEAQNSLLKALEEPPKEALIILGTTSEDQLLPTLISRCQIVNLVEIDTAKVDQKQIDKIEKLINLNMEQRFQFIEKLEEKEKFLLGLTNYFRGKLLDKPPRSNYEQLKEFLKDLIEAQKWAKQNVNIRAILEYLMLKMPNIEKNT